MILGHIYYAIGLLITLTLFSIVSKFGSFYTVREWVEKYYKVTGRRPIKEDFRTEQEYSDFTTYVMFDAIDFVWVVCGVLTSSWYVFLFLIGYTILSNLLRIKINTEPISKLISLQLVWIKLITVSYLVINHFHLHYNTWQLFIELFK